MHIKITTDDPDLHIAHAVVVYMQKMLYIFHYCYNHDMEREKQDRKLMNVIISVNAFHNINYFSNMEDGNYEEEIKEISA